MVFLFSGTRQAVNFQTINADRLRFSILPANSPVNLRIENPIQVKT